MKRFEAMRFVQILEDKRLWAVEYEGEGGNCFDLLFSNWYDMNWLKGFFKENLADLSSYFHITDVYEAVMETIDEAKRLECLMLDISPGGAWLDPVSELVRFRLRENASDPETAGSLAAQLAERICSASGIPSAGVAAGKIKDAAASGASVKDLISLVCSLRLLTRMI